VLPASYRPAVLADGSYATQVGWNACLHMIASCFRAGVAINRQTELLGLHIVDDWMLLVSLGDGRVGCLDLGNGTPPTDVGL
jgi:hypothetical protein